MIVWLGAIGTLFLLIALGSATPFFRLWWEVIPFSKSMRAPGMALFVVAFVTAVLAGFGADRVTSGSAPKFAPVALIVGVLVAILGISGVLGAIVESLGRAVEATRGLPQRGALAVTAARAVRVSAFVAGLALATAGVFALAHWRGKVGPRVWAAMLIALVGTDLWLNVRPFWQYSNVQDELFAGDAIKTRLRAVPRPFRVWDVNYGQVPAAYPGAALMADDIAQLYGHHGNEPHAFDVLNARQGSSLTFARAGDPQILNLFAVNYLIVHSAAAPDSLPGFHCTISNVATSSGAEATLFERDVPIAYARFIPSAAVPAAREQTAATVVDERFAIDRVVLLDSVAGMTAGAIPDPLPPPSDLAVAFVDWKPGEMRMRLGNGTAAAGYVLVSENWDTEWRATVDGRDAPVLRGNGTLITVPVPAGARELALRYEGRAYAQGRLITVVSLIMVAIALVLPAAIRARRNS